MLAYDESKDKNKVVDWVGRCWMILTSSLHDELYIKVSPHVTHGYIKKLLTEIDASLVVNTWEDAQPVRLELYGASMQKDCDSDLQTWVSFLHQKSSKLAFLSTNVNISQRTTSCLPTSSNSPGAP